MYWVTLTVLHIIHSYYMRTFSMSAIKVSIFSSHIYGHFVGVFPPSVELNMK